MNFIEIKEVLSKATSSAYASSQISWYISKILEGASNAEEVISLQDDIAQVVNENPEFAAYAGTIINQTILIGNCIRREMLVREELKNHKRTRNSINYRSYLGRD